MDRKPEKLNQQIGSKLSPLLMGVGILFLGITALLISLDKHHFFSYLTSYVFYLSLTLGAFFLVLIHHLTRAGWSVVIRRIPETLMRNITLMAVLFVPILVFGMHDLFHWTHAEAVATDHLLQVKSPYLNVPFFTIRAIIYFVIWGALIAVFYRKSIFQDHFNEPDLTLHMQKYSTFGVLLFALTISFASIDWIMSLTPHWFSTIFGVYYFAGSVVMGLATVSMIIILLKKKGYLESIVTIEHIHDVGKFLYGFIIFWTYIGFSQFFLIWYANIPEETFWYSDHFTGSWNNVAIFLIIGHFVIPFLLFMSRHVKRNMNLHLAMVCWMIFMHFVDLYWVIMPTASKAGIHLSIVDLTSFLGITGVYVGVFLKRLSKESLYPVQDPRLEESIKFHNV